MNKALDSHALLATGMSGTIGQHFLSTARPFNFRAISFRREFQSVSPFEKFTLIHSAGVVGTDFVKANPDQSRDINVTKTIELAKEASRAGAKRFVFISSSHIFGSALGSLSETTNPNPTSAYAEQKAEAEAALLELQKDLSTEIVILRVFSILGWESKGFTLGGKLRSIVNNGSGEIAFIDDVRDFYTPRQAADLVLKLSQLDELPPILNVGSGTGLSINTVSRKMFESVHFDISDVRFEKNDGPATSLISDNTLLTQVLGEKPPEFDPYTTQL